MDKRSRQVAVLAGLVYFTQGSLGLAGISLPLYLRQAGWSIGEITSATSIAAFPWIFKILYGLLSDCFPLFSYRRKSYLFLFAICATTGWVALAVFPAQKASIIAALLLSNLGLAATDVTTDGMIVEHSTGRNSHVFQSIAWGARSCGAIISGITGGWLASKLQPQQVFLITSFLPVMIIFSAFQLAEPKRRRAVFPDIATPFKRCVALLKLPNLRYFMAILLLSQASSSFGVPFFFHMKENLKFAETFLGALMSLGWLGVVIASIFYAKWISRYQPKTILRWSILLGVLNILSTFLIRDESSAVILVFLGGMMACLTLLPIMSISAILTHRSGVEGTLFAILMSVHNLGQIAFGYLGGKIFHQVGLESLIWASAILTTLTLLLVSKIDIQTRDLKPASSDS